MSDIRVFVTFPESSVVFAGEAIQCKITFKNVAPVPGASSSDTSNPNQQHPGGGGRQLQVPVPDGLRSSGRLSPRSPGHSPSSGHGGHRGSFSMTLPPKSPLLPPPSSATNGSAKHRRSVSIVSISSEVGESLHAPPGAAQMTRGGSSGGRGKRRPVSGHARSASMQVISSRSPLSTSPNPARTLHSHARFPSQPPTPNKEIEAFTFPAKNPSTPSLPPQSQNSRPKSSRSPSFSQVFKFPATPCPVTTGAARTELESQSRDTMRLNTAVSNLEDEVSKIDLLSPANGSESMSPQLLPSQGFAFDTPRSSVEFYSLSNGTNETLASEYDPRMPLRMGRANHNRRHSLLSVGSRASTESLMMGYAQVMGSFVVDGSLMQTAMFEEVKRKGVVSTHGGGGVVGLDTNKANSGWLGWGLGNLLGGGNMSTIAEMKQIANMKSVPVLSTPQSILFVDLRLAPGESKSYLYKFTLPKGIPPSHKGKALKITYNIVIGTQRAGKGVQHPKVIEVPFRVFPSVHADGSTPIYDLMSPVILLRDEATTICLDDSPSQSSPGKLNKSSPSTNQETLGDFMSYVNTLLAEANQDPHSRLLSPTEASNKRLSIYDDTPISSKDAVEMAILGNGGAKAPKFMFEIARNGRRVANVSLARPAYKLGETITVTVDFSNVEIPCYHLNASLESSETITPTLALRSPTSISRATRRIHIQHTESTLFTTRVIFTPTIPPSATPDFSTSGISSSWFIRLEFVTAMATPKAGKEREELLEKMFADDRGVLYEPRQVLLVESFDACFPVRVLPNGSEVGSGVGRELGTAAVVGYAV
ncbi:Rgp1-domain-containing protein [Ascodesmis nigricans]|uniref:Rgp1-domain-containing protein n=1 Tax=Ascodesmis nigricans TaxID=341454 RepID=A0A4S2N779_9PEZI|nr:Rgp1-domain-containing protein [Ascodesmis nigricans]